MMRRFSSFFFVPALVSLAWIVCVIAPARAAPAALHIGQERIDPAQLHALMQALQPLPPFGRTPEPAVLDQQSVEDYVQMHLLAGQARAQGLERDPQTAARLRVQSERVLAEAQRRKLMAAAAVDEASLRRRFAERPHDFDEYHLRHILVAFDSNGASRTPEQALQRARELQARLAAGADFAELAQAESDDHETSVEGGQLSAVFDQYLADAFAPSLRRMTQGQVSDPVRGAEGYHLIRLDQRRTADFAQVRPMLEGQLRAEAVQHELQRLARAHPVVLDRAVLEPASATHSP